MRTGGAQLRSSDEQYTYITLYNVQGKAHARGVIVTVNWITTVHPHIS